MNTTTDGGDAGGPQNAKIIMVHASPDLPAFRFCFGLGLKADGSDAVIAPVAPLPDSVSSAQQPYPGIFPGTGAPFSDVVPFDLSGKALTPYLIMASKIATDVKPDGGTAPVACDTLMTGDGGLSAFDIVKLQTIPAGALAKDTTLLLGVTGCLAAALDPTASVARCGPTWNVTTGNIAIEAFVLDRNVVDQGKMGSQVAHLSSPVEGVLQGGVAVGVNTELYVADGSVSLTAGQKFGELKPATAAANALANASGSSFVVTINNPDGGVALATVPFSLPLVAKFSMGILDAGYFQNGENYTFVIVGDSTMPTFLGDSGVFNGYALHVMAFPNNPNVK